MTTTVVETTADYHRWLHEVSTAYPQFSHELLRLFYAGEGYPEAAAIVEALGCPEVDAAALAAQLEAFLVPPGYYGPLFDAEEAFGERRMQGQHYQQDVQQTRARLAELQKEIEGTKAYSHIGEAQATEMKEKLEALDQERVDLLRHQGDLPGVGALIEQALAAARTTLQEAKDALQAARVEHLQQTEAAWLQEALRRLHEGGASVLALVQQARYLDQAWQGLAVQPGREHGSGRLVDVLTQGLRRAVAPAQSAEDLARSLPPPPRLSY